jgi:hypothetical protein
MIYDLVKNAPENAMRTRELLKYKLEQLGVEGSALHNAFNGDITLEINHLDYDEVTKLYSPNHLSGNFPFKWICDEGNKIVLLDTDDIERCWGKSFNEETLKAVIATNLARHYMYMLREKTERAEEEWERRVDKIKPE